METAKIILIIDTLKKLFPGAIRVATSFQGSGDNFDSFNESTIHYPDSAKDGHVSFEIEGFNDLLWAVIESSSADFNNGGTEGVVTIDLLNNRISIANDFFDERDYDDDGNEIQAPQVCDSEEFEYYKGPVQALSTAQQRSIDSQLEKMKNISVKAE